MKSKQISEKVEKVFITAKENSNKKRIILTKKHKLNYVKNLTSAQKRDLPIQEKRKLRLIGVEVSKTMTESLVEKANEIGISSEYILKIFNTNSEK